MQKTNINIKVVAEKSQVSIATVSRVLNKSGYVSTKTKERVESVIAKLGYRQNKLASNLRKKNTNYIGLIVPSINYDFFANLAKSIEHKLQSENFSLFLCNSDEDYEKEKFYIDSLINNQASGLIIVSANYDKSKEFIENSSIPMVLVDRFDEKLKQRNNLVCLTSDNFSGGKMAGDKFIEKGAKRLAFLMTSKKTHPQVKREDGIITSMIRNKVSPDNYRIYTTDANPEAVSAKINEIQKEFSFDALFCGNDQIAFGALYALLGKGVKIPTDIQLMGFDDIEIGRYLKPALSTIKQNVDKLGELAAEKLIDMILNNKVLNEQIIVPVQFIERDTTK